MTKKNLDVYIFEQLRDRMLAGAWGPGDRLDVDQLADDYQVSRTPVIQALRRMEDQGMIRVTRGGKFYLPAFSAREVEDICAVLAVLEQEAIRLLAAGRGMPDELSILAQELWHAVQREDRSACCRIEAEWHRRLVAAAGNGCLEECFSKALGHYIAVCTAGAQAQASPLVAERMMELSQALVRRDYTAVSEGLEDYLRFTCQSLCGKLMENR